MTVPGKGGRPRKWRTDADRVRAYRARQRGEEEPATLDAAIDDGDALAKALKRIRELQADVLAAAVDAGEAVDEVVKARRQTETDSKIIGDLRHQLHELRTASSERQRDIAELKAENSRLRQLLTRLGATGAGTGPNRAQRRDAQRRERKRGSG